MLDKRRIGTFGWLSSSIYYIVICTAILALTGCLSLWLFGGLPLELTPLPVKTSTSGYLLLMPGNISDSWQSYYPNDLPSEDESTLIDMKNFKFTMNHDTCNKTQPLLLTVIHSAPKNFQKRQVVRRTWARDSKSVVVLFFVGQSPEFQNQLEQENEEYGDLIQGNFIDSYRNMTYKHISCLKWAIYYCSSAKYVLKLDDDVFVHIPALLDFLKYGLSPWGARRLLLCDPLATSKVKRSWRSKWRVSPLEYPGREYPDYCAGYSILYSPDTMVLLYREAQKTPYFWIDDVHITGVLAQKLNLTHTSIHSLVLGKKDMRNLLSDPSRYRKDFLYGPPNLLESEIEALHELVSSGRT